MIEMPFASPRDYVGGVQPPADAPAEAVWFVFRGERLLVEAGEALAGKPEDPRAWPRPSWARLPIAKAPEALGLAPVRSLYLGRLGPAHCHAAEVAADAAPPQGYGWHGLRALFGVLDDAQFALAGRALQLVGWDRTHQFCGACGTPTVLRTTERARECPACKLVAYPRVAPAVMVLVRRLPEEIILARSPRFPPGMYSAIAGFVEPGETLEQCLERETLEEIGVRLRNVRYFASQPWPFPHSLMIAFVADWESGEIRADPAEIEAAAWFKLGSLPQLPAPISIARRLINAVIAEMVSRGSAESDCADSAPANAPRDASRGAG
jgi:NAD+ diphosphatase